MSRTDESGRDGLREAVERLAEELRAFRPAPAADAQNYAAGIGYATLLLDRILAEHPPTPAEEPAEVAVEEREAIYRAAVVCVRSQCDHEYDHECVSDWLHDREER